MTYEAEIQTDRMARRKVAGKEATRVTRLGTTEIASALRTAEKGARHRIDVITYFKGWNLTLVARRFGYDPKIPEQTVTLLDNVHLDRLFADQALIRRSPGGRVLPTLLEGEPDLTD